MTAATPRTKSWVAPGRSPERRDAELEAGTVAHYEDPAYYTSAYRDRTDDVHYYVDLARARGRGGVLEVGAGNGRITLPIARAGVDVVALDLSKTMLTDLRKQLKAEPESVRDRVRVVQGDMRRAKIDRKFSLIICPFNAFLHLYSRTDVERFLARCHDHLARGGELVFDVSIPEPIELARDPSHAYSSPRFRYPNPDGSKGEMVRYHERFDYDRMRQVLFVSMEFTPVNGGETWMTPLAHRQFFPRELEALLHYNGFELREIHGDFYGGPVASESETMILHARPRRTKR